VYVCVCVCVVVYVRCARVLACVWCMWCMWFVCVCVVCVCVVCMMCAYLRLDVSFKTSLKQLYDRAIAYTGIMLAAHELQELNTQTADSR
jgi:hypothetical protein